ncbi:hypothetical protein OAV62_01235 [bacterium]|nr:hypothetical protein [bacterium]
MLNSIKELFFPPFGHAHVYSAINWDYSIVGGSHAVQCFTKASWRPNNIDVYIKCVSKEDFEQKVLEFKDRADTCSANYEDADVPPGRYEEYGSVVGKQVLIVRGCQLPVHLIGIQCEDTRLETFLGKAVEIPCAFFRVNETDGEKMYYIPEKSNGILFTRMTQKEVSPDRASKYIRRGYTFI